MEKSKKASAKSTSKSTTNLAFCTEQIDVAIFKWNVTKYIRQTALQKYGQAQPLSRKDRSLMHITRVLLAVGLSYMVLFMPSYINKIRFMIMSNLMGDSYVTLKDHMINQIVLIISVIFFLLEIKIFL
jgi:hypothetical protein